LKPSFRNQLVEKSIAYGIEKAHNSKFATDPLPELAAPIAHSLVRQDDAALGHQLFDVTVAETEAKVQPDTVADNLCRKPMALIPVGYGSWIHAASMSHQTAAGKGLVNLTVPF
jgi:hypothetical protein